MSIRSATLEAVAEPTGEPTGRTADALAALARHERGLWALAALALVGDIVLTWYGLSVGLVEQNPVAASAIADHGVAAMAALKLPGAALALGWQAVLPRSYRGVAPLALALPWLAAVGVNAGLILVVS